MDLGIWRDYEQELKLLPAIRDRMDEHAHCTPTARRILESTYMAMTVFRIWNSVTVRIALGNGSITLKQMSPIGQIQYFSVDAAAIQAISTGRYRV